MTDLQQCFAIIATILTVYLVWLLRLSWKLSEQERENERRNDRIWSQVYAIEKRNEKPSSDSAKINETNLNVRDLRRELAGINDSIRDMKLSFLMPIAQRLLHVRFDDPNKPTTYP